MISDRNIRPYVGPNEGFLLETAKLEVDITGMSSVASSSDPMWSFFEFNKIR